MSPRCIRGDQDYFQGRGLRSGSMSMSWKTGVLHRASGFDIYVNASIGAALCPLTTGDETFGGPLRKSNNLIQSHELHQTDRQLHLPRLFLDKIFYDLMGNLLVQIWKVRRKESIDDYSMGD